MNFIKNEKYNGELLLRRIGITILAFLFLIVFESKPLINLLAGLSLFSSIIYIWVYDRKILQNNHYLFLFIVPYIVGFLLAFLSSSGTNGAIAFLDRFKFMLLVLPLATFIKNRKDLHILITMFFVSAAIAICYAIYAKQPYGDFKGFHKIGRTADMMVIASLTAFTYLVLSKFILNLRSILFNFLVALTATICTWAILMSEIRGSWLGLVIGYISFIFLLSLHRKAIIFKLLTIISIILSIMYFGNIGNIGNHLNRINNQAKSIIETQNNYSNEARLHLWKTGWDFSKDHFIFGTGAKQSKEMFIEFFDAQPDDYQNQYHIARQFPGDYHNSYIQVYIETGVVFFFFYLASFIYPLFIIFKNIKRVKVSDQKYLVAAITTSIAFLVTQIFHNELYSYGSSALYLVLFSGCYILQQNNLLTWFGRDYKNEM